uniref:Uncharacterized protein n=1 Tax=Candidatus Kentrum sp. DK TaxID=2126562 RepID=A0A450TN08_9GAMM|nr:MAG: hypothetical protein BECKDK2373C_GA0170839_12064 [Candidatus Kentron sp. DK]
MAPTGPNLCSQGQRPWLYGLSPVGAEDIAALSASLPFDTKQSIYGATPYDAAVCRRNYLPYEPVIGLSGRARLLPSRKYREIKLGGSLALPDKW